MKIVRRVRDEGPPVMRSLRLVVMPSSSIVEPSARRKAIRNCLRRAEGSTKMKSGNTIAAQPSDVFEFE